LSHEKRLFYKGAFLGLFQLKMAVTARKAVSTESRPALALQGELNGYTKAAQQCHCQGISGILHLPVYTFLCL